MAMKVKTTTPQVNDTPDEGEDGLELMARLEREEKAAERAAVAKLKSLVAQAADGVLMREDELKPLLTAAGWQPSEFAHRVRDIVGRRTMAAEVARLHHLGGVLVNRAWKVIEDEKAAFATLMLEHQRKVNILAREFYALKDEFTNSNLMALERELRETAPNELVNRRLRLGHSLHSTQDTLAVELEKMRTAEVKATSTKYSDDDRAKAAEVYKASKANVAAMREKIAELEAAITECDKEMNYVDAPASGTPAARTAYAKNPDPAMNGFRVPVSGGSVFPAELLGGPAGGVVPAPRAPAVQKVGG